MPTGAGMWYYIQNEPNGKQVFDDMNPLREQHLFTDGGMGTMLAALGLPAGAAPDGWSIERAEAVTSLHRAYLAAGATMVLTNTFGCNALRQKKSPYAVADLARAAAQNARKAVSEAAGDAQRYVALDIGPLGVFLEPLGDLEEEEAIELFGESIRAAAPLADCILIETMCDTAEAIAAIAAAKQYGGGLPVFCTLSFDARGRLLTGMEVPAAMAALEDAGADAVGCNCGVGPKQLIELLPAFRAATKLPLMMKPNAGLPAYREGKTVYDVTPEEFASDMRALYDGGVWAIGGCCGTTPAHIQAMTEACR